MFLENASQKGWIEVICGSMFSGKTEELIRRLKRAEFARLRVEIFKPRIDVRYSEEEVVSHDASAIRSTPVDSAQNILLMTSDVDVVGIDEGQVFDRGVGAPTAAVKAGAVESELAAYVEGLYRQHGADRSGEGQLVCFGPNGADPHTPPTGRCSGTGTAWFWTFSSPSGATGAT